MHNLNSAQKDKRRIRYHHSSNAVLAESFAKNPITNGVGIATLPTTRTRQKQDLLLLGETAPRLEIQGLRQLIRLHRPTQQGDTATRS